MSDLNFNKDYEEIIEIIEEIKEKVSKNDFSEPLHEKLLLAMKKLSLINPFNNIIVDMYAEAYRLQNNKRDFLDPTTKNTVLLKFEFWKEKITDSIDLIEL